MQEVSHYLFRGSWGGGGGVGERGGGKEGFSLTVHICLIFIIVARSIALFIQRELGRWLCWGGGGGGGVGERVRKATSTGKLAIDINNGVKVINHSQLLELSLIYIYASFAHD